jgi:uridylate kinase
MTKSPKKSEIIVLSLGGSLIIPEKVNYPYLKKFRKTILELVKTKKYKFVIVCGGGSIARKYISLLRKQNKSKKELSLSGIRATRMNALFMMQFFEKNANKTLPMNMQEVKESLEKNAIVFCGALRYTPKSTSDSTAANLAKFLKTDFINLTNIDGLYSSNPKTNKKAKFIPNESWDKFLKRANSIDFKAGQHFVLDQRAAKIIQKNKIPTYIMGSKISNLKKIIKNKPFHGTFIGEK